jgi:hypothetical protein
MSEASEIFGEKRPAWWTTGSGKIAHRGVIYTVAEGPRKGSAFLFKTCKSHTSWTFVKAASTAKKCPACLTFRDDGRRLERRRRRAGRL